MTTAVYTRISKDSEGKGLGVERQREDCMALASGPVRLFSDNDVSAFSGKRRPGYESMMAAVQGGEVTEIVAWAPDRLHRSPKELESFIELVDAHGVAVRTVQAGLFDLSTPAGRMVARQVGAVSRYESEHKSARLRRKARQLAEQGKRSGPVKYGWRNDDEAEVVRRIVSGLLAGDTLYSLRDELNDKGVPTAKGGQWTTTQVRAIAMRWSNAGLRTHHGEVVGEAEWPALVSREQQEAVVRLLSDPARRSQRGTTAKHVLTNILRCGVCGKGMVHKYGGSTQKSEAYRCPSHHVSIQADHTEALVLGLAQARLDAPDAAGLSSPSGEAEKAVRDRLAALRGRLEELAVMWAEGDMDRAGYQKASMTLRDKIAQESQALSKMERRSHALAETGVDIRSLPLERQRAVLRALFVPTVHPTGRTGRGFDPDRVTIQWVTGE